MADSDDGKTGGLALVDQDEKSNPGISPASRSDSPLAPENRNLFKQMLENQAEELEVRSDELKANSEASKRDHEFAMQSLQLQAQDRREHRGTFGT